MKIVTNHILEVVNNLATINRLALVIYLLIFLASDNFKPKIINNIVVPDIHRHALCLAFALTVDKLGALIVGLTIWLWRAVGLGGGAGNAAISAVPGMVLGSVLMAIGTILLLRILSIARYGNSIWLSVAGVSGAYVVWEFL